MLRLALVLGVTACSCSVKPEPEPVCYWPLTGEQARSGDAVRTRVVSVKVDNSFAARPPAGLAQADVVYESLAEGGVPRLNALFHSPLPGRVGPVRSARLSDTYLVPQYDALFAFSGASQTVRAAIAAAGIDDLGMESFPGLYERDATRRAPHNVFASVVELQAAAADAAGSVVLDIRLDGEGDAVVLRGGRRYDVT